MKSVSVFPHFFELNQTGHNSVNFEATASRFCMEEDLEEDDEVEEIDDDNDDNDNDDNNNDDDNPHPGWIIVRDGKYSVADKNSWKCPPEKFFSLIDSIKNFFRNKRNL